MTLPRAQVGSGRQAAQKVVRYKEAGECRAATDDMVAVKEVPLADTEAAALEALGGGRACRCASLYYSLLSDIQAGFHRVLRHRLAVLFMPPPSLHAVRCSLPL